MALDSLEIIRHWIGKYVNFLLYTPTRWYFILSCIVLALICYFLSRHTRKNSSLRTIGRFLFPSEIYRHRSTKVDLLYLLSLPVVAFLLFMPTVSLLMTASGLCYDGVRSTLIFLFGERPPSIPDTPSLKIALLVVFTVALAMGGDLGFYFHHWLFHKIPFLWEFHKVHHSAEVLTPLTDFRAHPIEILTYTVASGTGLGIVQGLFSFALGTPISPLNIAGMNFVIFVYYAMGYALRHSHFWISYGPMLNHVFISPAQHQIHHSRERKHWDKNFGGIFALWDWMFGSLYVPKKKEDLSFGLDEQESPDYSGVKDLYLRPFVNNWKPVRRVLVIILCGTLLFFAIRNLL